MNKRSDSIIEETNVPKGLKFWFVVHFAVDMIFAIPMMLFPTAFLTLFGWEVIDPVSTRVVAAALFGIGTQSFLGRNEGPESYRGMLNLKIIWSIAAMIGIGISLLEGAQGEAPLGWAVWGVFLFFSVIWIYWRIKLREKGVEKLSLE